MAKKAVQKKVAREFIEISSPVTINDTYQMRIIQLLEYILGTLDEIKEKQKVSE